MVKILDAYYEKEIHMVDSPFNEDSKNMFFFGQGRTTGKFINNGRKQRNLLLCKLGSDQV